MGMQAEPVCDGRPSPGSPRAMALANGCGTGLSPGAQSRLPAKDPFIGFTKIF
jgi:hypothetical protein